MPRLSVIVPVYNAALFLRDCVDSLLAQRFTDFEILLVDDGSTDGSAEICDDMAGKDPRIVVLHQEKGDASSARNRGIDHARGEYLVFVDADDLVTEECLGHLMESDADLIVTGLQMFGAKHDKAMPAHRKDYGIMDLAGRWNKPPVMNFLLYCFSFKRYRMRIIREWGIRFDESLFFSEDLHFNLCYYRHADSFAEIPETDYLYRITEITREEKYKMGAADLICHHDHLEDGFNRLYERIGAGALSRVQDNLNLRLIRKLYSYLMQDGITQNDFVRNVKLFRDQQWAGFMIGLLTGRREKRFMRDAVRFPVLTYWTENWLARMARKLLRK